MKASITPRFLIWTTKWIRRPFTVRGEHWQTSLCKIFVNGEFVLFVEYPGGSRFLQSGAQRKVWVRDRLEVVSRGSLKVTGVTEIIWGSGKRGGFQK